METYDIMRKGKQSNISQQVYVKAVISSLCLFL